VFSCLGVTSSNAATFGVGAIQVVATAISTWLVDKAGRRLLLTISSVGMTISLVIVAAAFYLKVLFKILNFHTHHFIFCNKSKIRLSEFYISSFRNLCLLIQTCTVG
jgi:MFS family permease